MQILVSLGVFGTESHYICPFRYRLGLWIKKFTKKNAIMSLSLVWSNLGASLSLSRTHSGLPWGFNFNLPTSIPIPPPPPRGVNPHLFLFEISRREKSQPRWKQSYRSKASVLLYEDELHIPFLLLNWVYVDVVIEHGWRDLRSYLQIHGNTAVSVINS